MKAVLLVAFVLVSGVSLVGGAILGPASDNQELFVYQQKIYVAHQLLQSECPNYLKSKREILKPSAVPFHLKVAKQVYNRLIESLIECHAFNADKNAANAAATASTAATSTSTTQKPASKDCQQLYEQGVRRSGVYELYLSNSGLQPFKVWCDFLDNHGWVVFHKRFDGSVDFYRGWSDYKNRFGSLSGEYWLGNDRIYALTQTNQILNVFAEGANGRNFSGTWTKFYISDESDGYRLTVDGNGYKGSLYNETLGHHNGMKFSTKDRDHKRCAVDFKGGWWYNDCVLSNLNGRYNHYNGFSGAPYHPPSVVTSIMRVTRNG